MKSIFPRTLLFFAPFSGNSSEKVNDIFLYFSIIESEYSYVFKSTENQFENHFLLFSSDAFINDLKRNIYYVLENSQLSSTKEPVHNVCNSQNEKKNAFFCQQKNLVRNLLTSLESVLKNFPPRIFEIINECVCGRLQ